MRLAAQVGLLIMLFGLITPAASDTTIGGEYVPSRHKDRSRTIDPDSGVYGIPFGATEEELVNDLGNPSGIVHITSNRRALLYGKSHFFVFRNGAFRELMISDHLVDWRLAQKMDGQPFFDTEAWTLAPGIASGMSFEEVRKILGRPNAIPTYRLDFDGDRSLVQLRFASRGGPDSSGPKTYSLNSLHIINFGSADE